MLQALQESPPWLAVSVGLVVTGLTYAVAASRPAPTTPPARVPLVVARVAVPSTRTLAADDMAVILVAERPQGALASAATAVGRRPLIALPAGQPVLDSELAPAGEPLGLWARVPAGKRAVAVPLTEVSGVAGFVVPGTHVDVISVAREQDRWVGQVVAQDLPVLAVAQEAGERPGAQPKLASSATLLVTPGEAEAISLAGERGAIRLALRGPNDHERRHDAPQSNGPAQAPPRPAAAVVVPPPRPAPVAVHPPQPAAPPAGIEIIRGGQSEVVPS